jgi:hypothetical protein
MAGHLQMDIPKLDLEVIRLAHHPVQTGEQPKANP